MDDVSLHSPVVRSSGPAPVDRMGQYTYDDEDGSYTPRRIWPADYSLPQRYAARVLSPREAPPTWAGPRQVSISHNALALLTVVGLVIFTCSTASLVIVAMLMDSTRVQVNTAADQIARLQGTLGTALIGIEQNRTQLDRLVSLMQFWVSLAANSTKA